MRIRVTTRGSLFAERKRQHVERGYRIDDEEPTPGQRSFVAVWESTDSDALGELIAKTMNGRHLSGTDD